MEKTEKLIIVDGKELKLIHPTIGLEFESNTEYARVFSTALKNGLMPQVVVEKLLRDAGAWTLEDDAKWEHVNRELKEKVALVAVTKDPVEKEIRKTDFYKTQTELYSLAAKRESLNQNTAEKRGEEAQMIFLIWNCALNPDGTKYWANQETFYKEQNNDFMKRVIQEFVYFKNGLEENLNKLDDILSGKFEEPEIEESKTENASEVQEIKEEAVAAS